MRALLRRTYERPATARVRVGALAIDLVSRQVDVGETPVELTRQEFALLHLLASEPTRVFTKGELRVQSSDAGMPGGHASLGRRRVVPTD